MRIIIDTIPHDQQRYPTAGDWQMDKAGNVHICVSNLGNWKHEVLVGVHELIEALLCKERDIAAEDVDDFDKRFEERRSPDDYSEPGDDPTAPYYLEHQFATCIERLLCFELGEDWNKYDAAIESL